MVLLPDLGAEQRLLAVGGERAGQRHAKTDGDRLAGRRLCAGRDQERGEGSGREERGHGAPPFQSLRT